MLRKFHQKQKGFTLVELMIVIAILGILAAIAIPEFNKYRVRGFTATTRSDTKNVHTAVQAWLAENLGGNPPVVNPPVLGPAGLAEYPPARVSTGVRIAVNSTGDVTGTHVSLTGAYVISADGAVTDTLGQ